MNGTKQKKALLLGRYDLGRELGSGAFAKVYYAKNPETNEEVAIKVIDKEKVSRAIMVSRILSEIETMKRARHPYIVHLHEVMATKSKIFLVMEFVKKGELFDKAAKGRMKEDLARKYFQQLMSAVAFCHARGVYHRDIKPENLLLDENDDLKVADFGLSVLAEKRQQDGLFHTQCGTPGYVAPEVLSRKGYDASKADLWSCGVVLFVLMAGYAPFGGKDLASMYLKMYKSEYRCPKWFSPDLIRLVRSLLEPDPNKRMTVSNIMKHPWFIKDFKRISFYVENDEIEIFNNSYESLPESSNHERQVYPGSPQNPKSAIIKGGLHSYASSPSFFETEKFDLVKRYPPILNAFHIISFSPGLDLSGLFEERVKEIRFVSHKPVSKIIEKFEEIARIVNFNVRNKNFKVTLKATEGDKKYGLLRISTDIFELTSKFVMVQVKKQEGDAKKYIEFCDNELKPRLRSLVYDGILLENSDSD